MPTTKRRLNVTLSLKLEKAIEQIAEQESLPQSTILVQLAEEALELNEDIYLSKLGDIRAEETTKLVSHKEAWGL